MTGPQKVSVSEFRSYVGILYSSAILYIDFGHHRATKLFHL